jgi:methionyl-tRNA synthetase
MTKKYFGGTVPAPTAPAPLDDELRAAVEKGTTESVRLMSEYHVADSLDEIFTMLRRANKYIDETMPWALAKDESKQARLNDVLYNLTEAILTCASLLDSFMPETAKKIFAAFGVEAKTLEECAVFGKETEYTATPVAALFQRLDFKTLEPEIEKIMEAQKASVAAPAPKAQAEAKEEPQKKAEITFEDFEKVELRVGEIIACEAVPKSNKLLKETVKFGDEVRTIVSGIAKHYSPEEMVGKKVVFVTNLAPRKICGITSEGMILAAEDENGTLSLCVSDKADLNSGANCG